MQCIRCGKVLDYDMSFCSQCGMPVGVANSNTVKQEIYKLPKNENRSYCITVNRVTVSFEGDFWYLKEKEFVKCKTKTEAALVQDFLGMGYLSKRSFRKCLLFIIAGSALELIKFAVDKLTELLDKINDILRWFDQSISLPDWVNSTMNFVAIICVVLAIMLFFSKKKVVEISFTDKRICVPKSSMTHGEYSMLYQSLLIAKSH